MACPLKEIDPPIGRPLERAIVEVEPVDVDVDPHAGPPRYHKGRQGLAPKTAFEPAARCQRVCRDENIRHPAESVNFFLDSRKNYLLCGFFATLPCRNLTLLPDEPFDK